MADKKVNTENVKVNAAKSLLRRANKELSSIPKYDFTPLELKMGDGDSAGMKAITNVATAVRRGIRKLKGGESEKSVKLKRKRLMDLIDETESLKDIGFDLGRKPTEKGKSSYTNQSKAQVLAKGIERRKKMR